MAQLSLYLEPATMDELRADAHRAGMTIEPNDLLIAAMAVAHQATLVTNNVKEFSRIPAITCENWYEIDL